MPGPMNPAPSSTWPALFPNMTTPQMTPASSFPNYNLSQAQFARGGQVHPRRNLKQLADLLEMAGEGSDTVLAHINPEEAEELMETHGGDINSYTGLPQFGFWSDIGRGIASSGLGAVDTGIQAGLRRGLPMAGRGVGTLLGHAVAAPTGATSVPQTFGRLGESAGNWAGNKLSNFYGGTGGLRGLVTPHLDVMAEGGFPNRQSVGNLGRGIFGDIKKGIGRLGHRGLEALDTGLGGIAPRLGSALGSRVGGLFGKRGSELGETYGGQLGGYAGERFGQSGGLSSRLGPKVGGYFGLNPMEGSGTGIPLPEAEAIPEMAPEIPAMARGGRVTHYPFINASHPLSEEAQMVGRHGEEDDMILAHINPEEAMELEQEYGSDVNPETGLPQFGFFKKLEKKLLRPFVKKVLPVIGAAGLGYGLGSFLVPGTKSIFGGENTGSDYSEEASPYSLAGFPAIRKRHPSENSENRTGREGILSQLAHEFGGYGNLGLLGLAGLGTVMKRERVPHQPSLAEIMEANKPKWGPEHQYRKAKPFKLKRKNANYAPGYKGEEEFFEETNPATEYFADGGYLEGGSGGQDDDIDARLSPGEYVMDATTVSLLGDGNNKAGAKKLDMFRKDLRTHKGVTKFLPPKSKPMHSYMRMGGRA